MENVFQIFQENGVFLWKPISYKSDKNITIEVMDEKIKANILLVPISQLQQLWK